MVVDRGKRNEKKQDEKKLVENTRILIVPGASLGCKLGLYWG